MVLYRGKVHNNDHNNVVATYVSFTKSHIKRFRSNQVEYQPKSIPMSYHDPTHQHNQ